MAKETIIKPLSGETEEKLKERTARRKGESLMERDLRQAGFDVFMPSFWNTVQHQRTNKLRDCRFPLLVGYAFVCIEQKSFEAVRKLETVSGFIRNERGPIPFDAMDIGSIALAEMERKLQFDVERSARAELNRQQRRNALNRQLGLILPKGRRRKIPLRMLAEAEIEKLSGRVKVRVREMLDGLNALDKEEQESACAEQPVAIMSAA
jgi:transcription antitermination factor NusG